jgi:tetratricopeptide (TPR) repeat protein
MTIGYAPPEQLHGRPEPRSDIYALGATIHRVLTRHDAANNKPTIFSFPLVRALRPDLSQAFEQVIARALEGNLEQRWASAADMERAIINLPLLGPQSSQMATMISAVPDRPTPNQPVSGSAAFTGPAGAFVRRAQDHLSGGRIEQAFAVLQQAYALDQNNPVLHKLYGQVFARRQPPQPEMALQAYNKSLQFNNNDPETHRLVGDVYLHLRRVPNMATPAYTQAVRINPRDVEAHVNLGRSFEATLQFPAALRAFQDAAALDPKRPDIHFHIGQVAQRLNQLQLAEQAYVQVLKINPADHATRFLLAQIYERENRLEDTWRECNFVVNAQPTNFQAQEMLRRLRAVLRR